jgi:Tol biopolymer transport system component/predicted Ser/Thr protein kinase
MPLSAGDKLGTYEILAPIGAGGMGEVYRARDTKLKREVALKVLPDSFARDPERMARFQREAEVLAALNHPNIAQIYGVEDRALVMELVPGESLKGPLPLETALNYARQIADALEAAHEKNIIHRDLKPANIMITPQGVVKVLDFGLAVIPSRDREGADSVNSATLTISPTRAGMILGTAGYMSPEQARGKPVDKRADIWAFGVVLFEMLTGQRLFDGETVSDTLAAVLKEEPDWTRVPAKVRRLLRACLQKDPKQRLQAIGDWKLMLAEDAPIATAPSRSRFGWVAWGVAAVLGVTTVVALWAPWRKPPAAELTRFQIPLPPNVTLPSATAPQEVSPDGRKLAFAAVEAGGKLRLWIRSLDSLDARPLPGIELANTPQPFFWSYDSRFLAFFSADHKLKKVDISGGPAQTLCDAADVAGGGWNRDGVILFGGVRSGVMRVSAAGGTPVALTAVDQARQELGHLVPKFLPDGRRFVYFRASNTPGNGGVYVGAIDAKPSEQSPKPLLSNDAFPVYYVPSGNSGSGHVLFYREETVLAQAFNPNKLELSGDPVPVAEQVGNLQRFAGFFSASTNGMLTYVGGNTSGNFQLTWFDRQGKNLGAVGEPGIFGGPPALSPDGKQAAATRSDSLAGLKGNLWLYDLTLGGAPARFTFDASLDEYPVFSPDGSRIIFASRRNGPADLYQKFTNGARNEEPLLKSAETKLPYSWSRDGRYLLYTVVSPKTRDDVWVLPMEGGKKAPIIFQGTEFNETRAHFSPDGHWIVYDSDETGRLEVYVREFLLGADGKPEATAPHLISNGGGTGLSWRDDGKELFYVSGDRRTVMSVEISTKPVFQSSPAKPLFQSPVGVAFGTPAADGKRFLLAVPVNQSGPQQFTVVQNWQAGLKK